eukprot:UN32858
MWEVTLFLTVGSCLQIVAAVIDLRNYCNFDVYDLYMWAVVFNFIGCACFLVGSAAGFFTDEPLWINLSYFLGSFGFAFGSWIYLWKWKEEQWVFYFPLSDSAQVSLWQQFMLVFIYCRCH